MAEVGLEFRVGIYRRGYHAPIMENQMEQEMENDMGII